jgi:hypothetical protein
MGGLIFMTLFDSFPRCPFSSSTNMRIVGREPWRIAVTLAAFPLHGSPH